MSDLSEREIFKFAMEHLSEALALLYESETDPGIAAAMMVDKTIQYMFTIQNGDDPRNTCSNFSKYEHEVYLRNKKHIKVIK